MNVKSQARPAAALEKRPPSPIVSFALANFKGSLKNRTMMAVMLLTPLMLLLMFWLISSASHAQSSASARFDLFTFILPGIIVFTVIQAGGPHATTLVNWREQGIFKRLACTPVPLWQLVLGRSLEQAVLALVQAALVLVVGLLLTQLAPAWAALLFVFLFLAVASICFIAFGAVIAGIAPNAVVANSLYIFLIIPMLFLGDAMMPASIFPRAIQRIGAALPTSLVTALVRPFITQNVLPANAWNALLGLVLYTVVFVVLSVRLFRWQ
jgi:ABC-2 type transport system permease protein